MFLNCLKTVVEFHDILWQYLVKYLPTTATNLEKCVPQWAKRPLSNNPYHNITVTYDFVSSSHVDYDDYPLAPALGYFCNYLNNETAGEFIFTEHNIIVPFKSTGTLLMWFGSFVPHATAKYDGLNERVGHLGTSLQIKSSFVKRVNKRVVENWKNQNNAKNKINST